MCPESSIFGPESGKHFPQQISLSICLSLRLSIYMFIYLSISLRLSLYRSIYLSMSALWQVLTRCCDSERFSAASNTLGGLLAIWLLCAFYLEHFGCMIEKGVGGREKHFSTSNFVIFNQFDVWKWQNSLCRLLYLKRGTVEFFGANGKKNSPLWRFSLLCTPAGGSFLILLP